MTCIVALKAEDRVYMGADTCVSKGDEIRSIFGVKIFKKGKFLFGCSGDVAETQVIQNDLDIYSSDFEKKSIFKYITKSLRNKIKDVLKENDCLMESASKKTYMSMDMLIGYKNRLFLVDDEFAFMEITENEYDVVGSGRKYALGAMEALLHSKECLGYGYEELILKSLEISQKYCNNVKAPFEVLHT
jgi:ATP-dependent protease HslVU (ClpYQ) peptidase subunit